MTCPICKSTCFDNRNNKRSAVSPDFRCSACGSAGWIDKKDEKQVNFSSKDKSTKVRVTLESMEVNAPAKAPEATQQKPAPHKNRDVFSNPDIVSKSVFTAWAKDLTVAAITNGKTIDDVFVMFVDAFNRLNSFLNQSTVTSVPDSALASTSESASIDVSEDIPVSTDALAGLDDLLKGLE